MAVGADFECINIEAAKYNREKKTRAEEARLAAARREAEYYRRELARLRAEAGDPRPKHHRRPAKTVRGRQLSAASVGVSVGDTGAVYAPGNSIGKQAGALIDELLAALGRWIKARKKAKREQVRVVRRSVRTYRPFPVAFVGTVLIFAVIAGMLLSGNAKLSEAKADADALRTAIAAETKNALLLDERLELGSDAAYVEDYAVNVLGMVKKTEVSKKYISLAGEDKIESRGEH